MFAGFSAFMLSKMGLYKKEGEMSTIFLSLWRALLKIKTPRHPPLGSLTVYLLLLHKCNSILSLILAGFPAFFFVKFLKYFCSYF